MSVIKNLQNGNTVTQRNAFLVGAALLVIAGLIVNHFYPNAFDFLNR